MLPPMPDPQRLAWLALLELAKQMPAGWTLVGGQLVHLHCAERGGSPGRATNDIDIVVDVRALPSALDRFTSELPPGTDG